MEIRDATADDVPFLARVMHLAARSHLPRGIWEYLYDFNEEQTLKYLEAMALTEAVHFCHHSLFLVAEVDGQPAAAMCGYDADTQGSNAMVPAVGGALESSDLAIEDFPAFMERIQLMGRVVTEPPPGSWVIENVAALPAYRRRGLVDELLKAVLARGRERGYELAQISVFIGNAPARNAYLKAGFEVVDEKRDKDYEAALGSPGIERLLQPLR